MKLILLIIVFLLFFIGTTSATITGDSPNPSGNTIIDINTTWVDESSLVCGGNITVGNVSQRIWFNVTNSTVEVLGKWTMGGSTPVNFTLENSTVFFNVTSGDTASQPSGAVYNSSQIIYVGDTANQVDASKIELKNSTIKGTDYSHLAGGIEIKSGWSTYAKHTVIVDNLNLSFVGAAIFGVGDTWALKVTYEAASDSSLENITLNYCGRGLDPGANLLADYITSHGGYLSFHGGASWNHLTMHNTTEGLYNPLDYAWIRNSWFNASGTKFNIMSASHTIFEYNTVEWAAFNAGAGSNPDEGNNNTLQHNEFIDTGVGGTKTGLRVINNTFAKGNPTGGNIPINIQGLEFWVTENTITEGGTSIRVVPHPDLYVWGYGHTIKNNIMESGGTGISLVRQYNVTVTNNSVNDSSVYGISVENSSDILVRDNSFTNITSSDIYFNVNNSAQFINNEFDSSKIGFADSIDVFENYYYTDIIVQTSSGTPISSATVTFTNEIDNSTYPCIDSDGNIQNTFTTGSDGHVLLPIGNRSESPVIMDYAQNNTVTTSMTWQIGADAVGYDANNSAITGLNITSGYYRDIPNTQQNTSIIVLGGWSYDSDKTYEGVTYRYCIDGTRTIIGRNPLETDKVVFIDNNSWPVVT